MKVVAIDSYGQKPSIREVAPPKDLESDDLIVRVRAAGMNPVDFAIAQGLMQRMWKAEFPLTLGSDFAGVVERLGEGVSKFRVGESVYGKLADGVLHQGAYGE